MIPYSRQYIDADDLKAVAEVLGSDWITQGPRIEEFETSLAGYCKAKYAVVFNSGTSALHGAYFALDLCKGDEFITSPLTFVATANAGLYLEAKPVFTDIEKTTGNLDASKLEDTITEKTKLVVPVHFAGHPAAMEAIAEIAQRHGLHVIEDACHALGAKYKGNMIGNCRYSDMTVLSFHPVKHITTGEGGAVLTNDSSYYKKLLMFRTHGITKADFINAPEGDWYYEMQFLGYNYRMTDMQAALGTSQLRKLDGFVEGRRKIADFYRKAFRDNPYFDVPVEMGYAVSSYHLYPIRLKDGYKDRKKEIFSKLRENGLGVQVHYMPVYLQPYYQGLGYKKGSCPVAEDYHKREISIPIFPHMTQEDAEYAAGKILEVVKSLGGQE